MARAKVKPSGRQGVRLEVRGKIGRKWMCSETSKRFCLKAQRLARLRAYLGWMPISSNLNEVVTPSH